MQQWVLNSWNNQSMLLKRRTTDLHFIEVSAIHILVEHVSQRDWDCIDLFRHKFNEIF